MQAKIRQEKALENLICVKGYDAEKASTYIDQLVERGRKIAGDPLIDSISRIFKALSDRTRLKIIPLLQDGEMCVCEISVALGLTQPTASHHLMILENAGIVEHRKEGRWAFYRI